ncbi:MAG: preprotein translocase subunit SecE [Clostridia bacterium]|nr:preprotein translocase subunit SecE [Clostridia bacterium]
MASEKNKEKKSFKNFMIKIGRGIANFFKNIGMELRKVTWLDRKDLFKSTLSVLAVCLIVGALIFGIDTLLQYLIDFVRP